MKLDKINKAFSSNKIAKDVAKMIATSHEYKIPNEKGAIKLVSNYSWEKRIMDINKIQGINKPVNKEKVFNIAKTIKPGNITPFMVVDKFQGIKPQSPGSKILLDGHHRKEACELKGIKQVPVYYGKYTGEAEKSLKELIEKKAEENVFYHASPYQGIKKFRLGEDTSGNNKGKVLFASAKPEFAAAFGTKWNDSNARLNVTTKNKEVPKINNYAGSILKYTDKVKLDKPCSMYKLKGDFKPLRYPGDLEVITKNKDNVKILSEERFDSFKNMAKAYNVKLEKVEEKTIYNKLKDRKFSNFEKKADFYKSSIEKIAVEGIDNLSNEVKNQAKDYINKSINTLTREGISPRMSTQLIYKDLKKRMINEGINKSKYFGNKVKKSFQNN